MAALSEELGAALDLCRRKSRLGVSGIRAWKGMRGEQMVHLLRSGLGPVRAERSLTLLLSALRPDRILVIGYAGALDPGLRLGDLVVAASASLFDLNRSENAAVHDVRLSGTWPLQESGELIERGNGAGLSLKLGTTLTSPYIIGAPEQKLFLGRELHASIIDMETAALARASTKFSVPLACVRAVSDTAQDDFLAPFSYEPGVNKASRSLKALAAGNWFRRYSQWRENAGIARLRLREFLAWYLDSFIKTST